MLGNQEAEEEIPKFNLQSGCDSFVTRSKDVFASLQVLEEKHSAFLKTKVLGFVDPELMKDDPEDDDSTYSANCNKKDRLNRKQRQTRESDIESRSHSRSPTRNKRQQMAQSNSKEADLFKHPSRVSSQNYVPDFKKHPEKYTCYTLSDVSEKDMSDKSNQHAALAFLEEQRINRETKERELLGLSGNTAKFDVTEAACSQGKITFSRPRVKKDGLMSSESCASQLPDITDYADDKLPDDSTKDLSVDASEATFKSRKNIRRQIRRDVQDSD